MKHYSATRVDCTFCTFLSRKIFFFSARHLRVIRWSHSVNASGPQTKLVVFVIWNCSVTCHPTIKVRIVHKMVQKKEWGNWNRSPLMQLFILICYSISHAILNITVLFDLYLYIYLFPRGTQLFRDAANRWYQIYRTMWTNCLYFMLSWWLTKCLKIYFEEINFDAVLKVYIIII